MSQTAQPDIITLANVASRLPAFCPKCRTFLQVLSKPICVHHLHQQVWVLPLKKQSKRNPQGDALLFEDERYSYQDLNEWANQIAHYYLSIGARKGDVIAVMLENRSELIATVIGLAKIGVTIALVNTSQTGKVLTHSINLVNPIALIFGEEVQSLY